MSTMITPTNALPYSQRLRLLRSIRKLGDLITESSLLVESAPPVPSHSRSISMSSPSGNTSWSAIAMTDDGSSTSHLAVPATSPFGRNFFSLRLPNAKTSTPLASPLSPTFSALNSPSTPVVDPATLKERKLAKVTQTLGENVPPELVFPPNARPGKGRKRASTVSVPEYTPEQRAVAAAAGATVVSRRRHARARAVLKHAASSTSLKHAASSASLRPVELAPEPFSYPSLVPVPSPTSDSLPETPTTPAPPARENPRGMHRREAGWSGEWSGSVQNMDDVLRGLRGLRFK